MRFPIHGAALSAAVIAAAFFVASPATVTAAATALTTSFEQHEGFGIGPIHSQGGWTAPAGPHQHLARISAANPSHGQQHLRFSKNPVGPGGAIVASSPDHPQPPNTSAFISVDFNVSNADAQFLAGGGFWGTSPTQGLLSFGVTLSWEGVLYVMDLVDDELHSIPVAAWVNGPGGTDGYRNLAIHFEPDQARIRYYLDGALLHTGVVFGATNVDQLHIGMSNYYQPGPFGGGFDEIADWDNLIVVPEPAAMAVAGLASLALLRRREFASRCGAPC